MTLLEILTPTLTVIASGLVAGLVSYRVALALKRWVRMDTARTRFVDSLNDFLAALDHPENFLNDVLFHHYPVMLRHKHALSGRIPAKRREALEQEWQKCQEEYEMLQNMGPSALFTAIAPSVEALQNATHDSPREWEQARAEPLRQSARAMLVMVERL